MEHDEDPLQELLTCSVLLLCTPLQEPSLFWSHISERCVRFLSLSFTSWLDSPSWIISRHVSLIAHWASCDMRENTLIWPRRLLFTWSPESGGPGFELSPHCAGLLSSVMSRGISSLHVQCCVCWAVWSVAGESCDRWLYLSTLSGLVVTLISSYPASSLPGDSRLSPPSLSCRESGVLLPCREHWDVHTKLLAVCFDRAAPQQPSLIGSWLWLWQATDVLPATHSIHSDFDPRSVTAVFVWLLRWRVLIVGLLDKVCPSCTLFCLSSTATPFTKLFSLPVFPPLCSLPVSTLRLVFKPSRLLDSFLRISRL